MDHSPYSAFAYETFYPWNEDAVGMWALGVGVEWEPADTKVISTLIRPGNFDYVTNSVKWDSAIEDHDLPNSLYLAQKPAFFSDLTWPWVQPEGTTKLYSLPARIRFDQAHGIASMVESHERQATVHEMQFDISPNPFNPSASLAYRIQESDQTPAHGISVRISVYTIRGTLVTVQANGPQQRGPHNVTCNAAAQPAGVYILRLEAGNALLTRKMTLVK